MRTWKARLALCFILGAVGAVVAAPQAMAACTDQYVCLFNGPSGETPPKYFHDNGLQNLVDYSFNDLTSYVNNSTSRWAVLREHSNGTGALACISPYTIRTFWGSWFNNQASAIVLHPFGQVPNCSGGY